MEIAAYQITPDRLLAPVDTADMSDDWFVDDTIRWIKVTSATPDEVEQALRPLELHPRIVDACVNPQLPQVEVLEKVLFMAMPVWRPEDATDSSVRFVGVPTTLITIQDEPVEFIEDMAERLQGDNRLLDVSTAALTLHLTEAMVKSLLPGYLALRSDVNTTAKILEDNPGDVETNDILGLKHRASRLSDQIEDCLFCLTELQAARSETLEMAKVRTGFQELVGDLQGTEKPIARMEERIRDLRQAELNYLQESTNHRLNILAVLSAIYLPSTLIAGVFGMNFDDIPATKIPHGYFFVLALMIGLVAGQLIFFYRRGWFK